MMQVSKEVRESDWYQDLNMSIGAILGIMLAGVLVILCKFARL